MNRIGRVLLSLLIAAGVCGSAVLICAQEKKTLSDSFKGGFDKVFGKKEPPPEKLDSSLSLTAPAKPSVGVYVAVARLYEQHGKWDLAEQQYQQALKAQPNDVVALLGYAGLKEKTNKPDEALKLYQKAVEQHPNEAAVHNNLGLFFARRNQTMEAVRALSRAVSIQPDNPLYRNNLATVLVDMNRIPEAFTQFKAVHGEAGAYYNLAYLLQKKGKSQEAIGYFAAALRADPNLQPARQWLAKLQGESSATGVVSGQAAPMGVVSPGAGSSAAVGPSAEVAHLPASSAYLGSPATSAADQSPVPSSGQGNFGPGAAAPSNTAPLPPMLRSERADVSRTAPAEYSSPQYSPTIPNAESRFGSGSVSLDPTYANTGARVPSRNGQTDSGHSAAGKPAPTDVLTTSGANRPMNLGASSPSPANDNRQNILPTAVPSGGLRLSPKMIAEAAPLPPTTQNAFGSPNPAAWESGSVRSNSADLPSAPLPPGDPSRLQRLPLVR